MRYINHLTKIENKSMSEISVIILIAILFPWIWLSAIIADYATDAGMSGFGYLILSLVVSPVIGALFLIAGSVAKLAGKSG